MTDRTPDTRPAERPVPAEEPRGVDAAVEVPRRTSWASAPFDALRGGLVGAAESVPGISGGTIALVVGLYDQLIASAGHVVHAARAAVTGGRAGLSEARASLREVDWRLLVPVLVGMVVVLLVSLQTIAPLLVSHPVPMRALFLGMIAASVAVPLRMMPGRFRPLDALLLVAGVVVAYALAGLPPNEVTEPSLWYVALGAAIAINALVLPGVSGSALLVVLGLYVPAQVAVEQRDLAFVGAFFVGAAVGLGAFVKLLQWLLNHRRQATMATLAGLMVGSLRALWPWQGDDGALEAPSGSLGLPLAAVVAGAVVVGALVLWEHRRTRRA